MNKIDKDIYLDVDGTLTREPFRMDAEGYCDRDNIAEFIEFLTDHFKNVYWLTANRRFALTYLPSIGRQDLADKMKFKPWNREKYDVLDYTRGFYMIDDEVEYDHYHEAGLLLGEIPGWKKEPYKSKIDPEKHHMVYVRHDAPKNYLTEVIKYLCEMEKIDFK